jgi:hypothetical protein
MGGEKYQFWSGNIGKIVKLLKNRFEGKSPLEDCNG